MKLITIFRNSSAVTVCRILLQSTQRGQRSESSQRGVGKEKINLCGSESRTLIPIDHEGWKYEDGENQVQGRLDKICSRVYQELTEGHIRELCLFISKMLQRRFDYYMNWEDALRQITFGSRRGKREIHIKDSIVNILMYILKTLSTNSKNCYLHRPIW